MAIQLDQVVPFGRSLAEYELMFNLTEADWATPILSVADGPASFNAEAAHRGRSVLSLDPIYQFTGTDIQHRFEAVLDLIMAQIAASPADWVWGYHPNLQTLRDRRVATLHRFLQDYDLGKQQGRYQPASLPDLPCGDRQFRLALCSHFLLLYSDQCDRAFHLAAVRELLRVSQEVRIFPLLTLGLTRSPHLSAVMEFTHTQGGTAEIVSVQYELQRGANEMLVLRSPLAAG